MTRRVTESYYNHNLRKYTALLFQLVVQSGGGPGSREELMRLAERELLWVMIHFDSQRGNNLAAYVAARIRWRLQHHLRDERRYTKRLCGSEIHQAVAKQMIPYNMILDEILTVCDKLEREVLVGHHIMGKTFRQIGDEKGVSYDTAWRASRSGIAKIRERFPVAENVLP